MPTLVAGIARRVLVADDDAVILRLLEVNFSLEGYEVTTADRGEAALELAGDRHYDLIVLDVMMPGMDGWEVCERLKADPSTAGIPVIFLSARTQDATTHAAYSRIRFSG